MLYIDKIDVSEGTGIKKTRESKECDICHYCYVLDKGFKFKLNVCNGCHDLLMMSMNLDNIAILKIRSADYHCIISRIMKSEAINLMQNANLTEKSGTLSNIKIYSRI